MEKKGFIRKIDRRTFLQEMALVGGVAFLSASPVKVFSQEGKKRIPPISIIYYTVVPEQEDIWKLTVQDWQKLGLEFQLKVLDDPVLHGITTGKHDFGDIASVSWLGSPERLDPSWHLGEHYLSRRAEPGGRNFGHYINPEYDKYFDLQAMEMDRNKRRDLVWKCQEIAARDYPIWWMGYGADIQAYNSRDWEGVVPMPGSGIGTRSGTPWTFLKMKSKTKKNMVRVADFTDLDATNVFSAINSPGQQTLRWIYDTYTKLTPNLEVEPWAAESWRIVNPKTVDITLRSGMKFHDGKPVTVQDVKFSWDYPKKWKFPLYNWICEPVERTEILDDRNVRFHLVQPHAPFIEQTLAMAVIAPKHIWEKIPDSVGLKRPHDWENAECIGSGPFKLGYIRRGEELHLIANKEHFRSPNIDGIYFRLRMNQDAMVSALIAGEVDILGGDVRPSHARELERYNYIKAIIAPNHRAWMARADLRRKPFDDREFRRALYHAIDLKKINAVIFEGTSDFGRNTPIAPVLKFWHNSKIPLIDFSIDKARKILKDAGYSWDHDGHLCFSR